MPTDKPITLQEHAMRFGTFMGIFWIFKFIFLPLGFTIPLLQLLFVLLTLFVPVLEIHTVTVRFHFSVLFYLPCTCICLPHCWQQ